MMDEEKTLKETHSANAEKLSSLNALSPSKEQQDETAYLLSTEANRLHLMAALQAVENEEASVIFTAEEWTEQYGSHT